ncbi:MAG: DUF1405 domain-containing protein [Promethearchaeota archaeon]
MLEKIRIKLLSLPNFIIYIWMILNIIASLYTIYLYSWQYVHYPMFLWIFIPDCGTFGILFAVFLLVTLISKRNNQKLNLITFIGIIKVFFASFLIFIYNPYYFDVISFIGHLGLLIEAFLLLPFMFPTINDLIIGSGIHGIDWFFDFFNPLSELPTIFLYNEPNHPTAALFNELLLLITFVNILSIMSIYLLQNYLTKSQKPPSFTKVYSRNYLSE